MPKIGYGSVFVLGSSGMVGQGVYTLEESARYTRLPPTTLRAWFKPRSDGAGLGPIFQSDYEMIDDDFAISFLNLMEAYVASFFKKNGVKPRDIRRTQEILKDQLGAHPFAHAHLSTGLGRIVYETKKPARDKRYVEVISRQLLFPEFTDGLHRIRYSPVTQLADSWQIKKGIVVSPMMGFGKPVIEHIGVSTLIVANQYVANEKDAALVARLFRIPKESVERAYRFEKSLGRIAA